MKTTNIPELDQLYSDVLSYKETKRYTELLSFVAKFRKMAPYNAMLIHLQKPGSDYVASATDWKNKFGRGIKPNARPIVILKQFGPVSFVFDYSDTIGNDELPDDLVRPFKTDEFGSKRQLDIIRENMLLEGIVSCYMDMGTNSAGFIQQSDSSNIVVPLGRTLYTIRSNYQMIINENLKSPAEQLATIFHELGHFYCGHLNSTETWLPMRSGMPIVMREFEAESVSWLMCERLGIHAPSVEYLSDYLEGKEKYIPDVSIDTIMKATGNVERLLGKLLMPRKELIVSKEKKC